MSHQCPCGFFTDPKKQCTCTPLQIQRHFSKVSGPLLDRIDIQLEVPGLRYQELASKDDDERSAVIRERVNRARVIQLQRFDKRNIHANAQMGTKDIKRYYVVREDAEMLFGTTINKLGLSAHAYSRVRKLGRTIADLAGSKEIQSPHIAEAIQYRIGELACLETEMIGKPYAGELQVRFDEGEQDFVPRLSLNGHAVGNDGYSQGLTYRAMSLFSTLPIITSLTSFRTRRFIPLRRRRPKARASQARLNTVWFNRDIWVFRSISCGA